VGPRWWCIATDLALRATSLWEISTLVDANGLFPAVSNFWYLLAVLDWYDIYFKFFWGYMILKESRNACCRFYPRLSVHVATVTNQGLLLCKNFSLFMVLAFSLNHLVLEWFLLLRDSATGYGWSCSIFLFRFICLLCNYSCWLFVGTKYGLTCLFAKKNVYTIQQSAKSFSKALVQWQVLFYVSLLVECLDRWGVFDKARVEIEWAHT